MKKIVFQIICVLMLLLLGTVAVFAEDAEQVSEPSTVYVISSDEVVIGSDGEYKIIYSETSELVTGAYIIIGGMQNGEFSTYVFDAGDFSANFGEYFTFVLNGENIQGVLAQTEPEDKEMITVNCSSLIAPAASMLLVTGTLIAAWGLKKKRDGRENP